MYGGTVEVQNSMQEIVRTYYVVCFSPHMRRLQVGLGLGEAQAQAQAHRRLFPMRNPEVRGL